MKYLPKKDREKSVLEILTDIFKNITLIMEAILKTYLAVACMAVFMGFIDDQRNIQILILLGILLMVDKK